MKLFAENITPVLVLCINLLASISYFYIYSNPKIKKSFFRLPQVIQKLYVAFFVLPLFIAPFTHQTSFTDKSAVLVITGILLSVSGLSIILLSFLQIGLIPSIKSKGGLSTRGVYELVRHPIYFGTIAIEIGLILCNQSLVSLLYLPISVILYYLMATLEEKDLIEVFGDEYLRYKANTKKKIIPFLI